MGRSQPHPRRRRPAAAASLIFGHFQPSRGPPAGLHFRYNSSIRSEPSVSDSVSTGLSLSTAAIPLRTRLNAYLVLSKARLSLMVVITTLLGFVLGSAGHRLDWATLTATLVGTTLAAFGANSFNQWLEADRDRRMRRTQSRPLPAGLLRENEAGAFAAACSIGGPLILLWFVNLTTGLLGLGTVALYTLVYTPMKVRSVGNTFVGAIVGAIPPVMGWVAAGGPLLAAEPALLAALLFAWQMPHFLALAWLYREDYQRGGFRMLPCVDATGVWTAWTSTVYAVALLPITLGLWIIGACGVWYAIGSSLATLLLIALGIRLVRSRTNLNAKRLFLASIAYLPFVLLLIGLDRPAGPAPARDPLPARMVSLSK
jgi:protoheme IX farnesyltransferase